MALEIATKTNVLMDMFWPVYVDTTRGPEIAEAQIQEIWSRLKTSKAYAIDFETKGTVDKTKAALDFQSAGIVGFSVCWKENAYTPWQNFPGDNGPIQKAPVCYPSVYVPLDHKLIPKPPDSALELLKWMFTSDKAKCFFNQPFDGGMAWWRLKIPTRWPWIDASLQNWIYDENGPRKLKDIAKTYWDWEPLEFGNFSQISFDTFPPVTCYRYACQDAYLTYYGTEWFVRNTHPAGNNLLTNLEMPTQRVFNEMHFEGIPTDLYLVRKYQKSISEIIEKIQKQVHDLLGNINLNSGPQLKKAFLERAGIKLLNTQSETLKKIDHPAARLITLSKKYEKYKTYVDGIEEHTWKDGKIHPQFLQWYSEEFAGKGKAGGGGARTGRSSAKNPAVQTYPSDPLPIPTDLNLKESTIALGEINVRRCWKAPDGWKFVKADASQLEPRTAAALTGEPLLIEAYENNRSVYTVIGTEAMRRANLDTVYTCKHCKQECYEIDSAERHVATLHKEIMTDKIADNFDVHPLVVKKGTTLYHCFKTIVLGQAYGAGPDTIWTTLQKDDIYMDLEDVRKLHDWVSQVLPQITQIVPSQIRTWLQEYGYVETVFGRRRHFPKFSIRDRGMVRQAVNFWIGQSPGFDMMKRAMLYIESMIDKSKVKMRMVGQIHDEIFILAPDEEVADAARLLYAALTQPFPHVFPYKVPLDAEVQYGQTYGDLVNVDMSKIDELDMIVRSAPRTSPQKNLSQPDIKREQFMSLLKEVSTCMKCDLFNQYDYKKVGPKGAITQQCTLAWLNANPNIEDLELNQPMMGRSGSLLKQEAYLAGLPTPPQPDCISLNALWCHSPDTSSILNTYIGNCRPNLDKMLEIVQPKIVIALGSIAARSILRSREASVESNIGWHELPTGIRVFVTYNPGFLLKSPGYISDFRKHLEEIRSAVVSLART